MFRSSLYKDRFTLELVISSSQPKQYIAIFIPVSDVKEIVF